MLKTFALFIAAMLLGALPAPARAQWTFDPNFAPSIIYPQVNNPCPDGNCGPSESPGRAVPEVDLSKRSTPTSTGLAQLNFNPSPTVRQANLARFLGTVRSADPTAAAQIETIFASDVFVAMERLIAPYGLRTNNMADAYTVYWISAWEASRGIETEIETRSRVQAVKMQAVNALLANPAVINATAAQKQEFTEALLIQSLLIATMVNGAKSNPAVMRQVSASVAQGAQAMGLDLKAMTLTDGGFVPNDTIDMTP